MRTTYYGAFDIVIVTATHRSPFPFSRNDRFCGRFSPLPTPTTHGSWSKLNGRFTPKTCLSTNINSKPREARYKAGLAGYLLYPVPRHTPEGLPFQTPLFRAFSGQKSDYSKYRRFLSLEKICRLCVRCMEAHTSAPPPPLSTPPLLCWKWLPEIRLKLAEHKWRVLA